MLPHFAQQKSLKELRSTLTEVILRAGSTIYLFPTETSNFRIIGTDWPAGILQEQHFEDGKWPLLAEGFTPILMEDPDHADANSKELVVRYYPGLLPQAKR